MMLNAEGDAGKDKKDGNVLQRLALLSDGCSQHLISQSHSFQGSKKEKAKKAAVGATMSCCIAAGL